MKPFNFLHQTLAVLLLTLGILQADDVQGEIEGIVAIEVEDTDSPLGNWKKKTEIEGYSGVGYLEFTGNTPIMGPPDSPLEFHFKIERGGYYFLHFRCAREMVDGRDDLANDAYVRLEGDFGPGPNPGDQHKMDAPLEMLRKDTKFFGGADRKFVWASGNRLDPGGHNNKRVAVYHLEAGETYTLTLSGRSQRFKVDRILFRHEEVPVEEAEKPE